MLKKFTLLITLIFCSQLLFASGGADSLKQRPALLVNHIDSLKKQLELTSDSLKGSAYIRIADEYIRFDTISNRKVQREYQDAAISNAMSALHYFSKYDDSVGLRRCFDNLAKVYHAQKKYTQAKWFTLQSNGISRAFNDDPGTIASLLELASIKSDIGDYTLAMRDLNEALSISGRKHYPQMESQVQLSYAMLYNSLKNPGKAAIALKRHQAIDDSIKKAEDAMLLAKQKEIDSAELAKKKAYLTGSSAPYAFSSSKKQPLLPYSYLSSF
ncbi:MAG: tetratricopeptide repeat protein [Bacteroidetes bacterium]|nr:tetratricopeptide repeat protein [Bacteroidota bacterium]